jgi:hypothetical protein
MPRWATAAVAATVLLAAGATGLYLTRVQPPAGDVLREDSRVSEAPRLLAPRDAGRVGSDSIVLRWSRVEGASSYRCVVLSESGDAVVQTSTPEDHLTLDVSRTGLVRGNRYYWYVAAEYSGMISIDSEVARFSLEERTGRE